MYSLLKLRPSLTTKLPIPKARLFTTTIANMGVTKTTTAEGTGAIPKDGDKVIMEYTGFVKDTSKPGNKGAQ